LATAIGMIWGGGCAAGKHPTTGPTTSLTTTKAATKPTNETLSVELKTELGAFAPRARGVLRPKPSVQLPPESYSPLGAMAKSRDGGPPPTLITLGDSAKWDGAFPGEKGKWTKWDQGVDEVVRHQLSEGKPTVYEVWKEPDDKRTFKEREDFFGAWVHTVRRIRQIAPKAVIQGPSITKHDGGWIGDFLKMGKEFDVLPDLVSWHEDGLKHDISGHIGGTADAFWQDGTDRQFVVVSANANIDDKARAGDPAIFLAQMEKSAKDNAWRTIKMEFGFKLTHLFTNDLKPRSVYHTYREYAALAGAGRSVKVNSSPTVDGVAVWDKAKRTVRVLIGRNRSRMDDKQVPGDVTLQVKGAAAATARVVARRIADTGANPSDGPELTVDDELPVKNGEVNVRLPKFVSGDACAIEITFRGDPPATTTAPTTTATKPATTRAAPKR
jgi:hypothetical protein